MSCSETSHSRRPAPVSRARSTGCTTVGPPARLLEAVGAEELAALDVGCGRGVELRQRAALGVLGEEAVADRKHGLHRAGRAGALEVRCRVARVGEHARDRHPAARSRRSSSSPNTALANFDCW